jgi:hypothetical protein
MDDLRWLADQPSGQIVEEEGQRMVQSVVDHLSRLADQPALEVPQILP